MAIPVQGGDDLGRRRGLVIEIRQVLERLNRDSQAGFQSLRRAKLGHDPLLERGFLDLKHNGVRFFQGDLEVAVLFELPFGDLPPFLPVVGYYIRDQNLGDLVQIRFAAKALQDELDEVEVVESRHLAQPLEIGNFAGVNVVGGNRFERLRREGKVHRVARPGLKIDAEPGEDCVHRGNFAEAPTAVRAIAALGQQNQRLDVALGNLSRRRELFKLFSHK